MEEVINIEWSGPYSYTEIKENTEKKGFNVKPSSQGLYQIYGKSPIYGDNVLLYIGETTDKDGFTSRLNGRGLIVNNADVGNIQIYLGEIFYSDGQKHEAINTKGKSIDLLRAESLLIHYHKPSNNSSCINSLKYAEEDFRIINHGNYRSLHKEISTKSYTKEIELYSLIDEVAKGLHVNEDEINECDDWYGYDIQKLWFGVDYDLWNDKVSLILESDEKFSGFIERENRYYKPLYGTKDEIIKEIKTYL